MSHGELGQVASLIAQRNALDAEIAAITGRPVVTGHLGEWIAAQILDITLESSAVAKGIDGRFASGPLAGRTVNVKWYAKRDGTLDLAEDSGADFYLVMTGPRAAPASSRGETRPLRISAVHLFSAPHLLDGMRARGAKIGTAASVRSSDWDAAEIFPHRANPALPLSDAQRQALGLFAGEAEPHRVSAPGPSATMRDAARRKAVDQSHRQADGDLVVFRGDDGGYVNWLVEHPSGYVVNAERSPRPRSLKLHHAACRHISGPPRSPGAWTEREYIKICGKNVGVLEQWAGEAIGGALDRGCSCI